MPCEAARRERVDQLHEARVQRRLASGQRDVGDAINGTGLVDDLLDESKLEIIRCLLGIARAMLAIELTAIRKMKS